MMTKAKMGVVIEIKLMGVAVTATTFSSRNFSLAKQSIDFSPLALCPET